MNKFLRKRNNLRQRSEESEKNCNPGFFAARPKIMAEKKRNLKTLPDGTH